MGEKISVLGLMMSFPPYPRSAMVRFPLMTTLFVEQPLALPVSSKKFKKTLYSVFLDILLLDFSLYLVQMSHIQKKCSIDF